MKAQTMLAALMLASALNVADAGTPPPPPRTPLALDALIDDFLAGRPADTAAAARPAPDFQPYRQAWQALLEHASAIPEREPWTLTLAGIGVLAAVGRRLKDKGTGT